MVVPALTAAIADDDPMVREAAARAIASFKADAAAALPALVELLHDDDVRCQAAAAFAVSQLGAAADPHMPLVLARLDHPLVGPSVIEGLRRRGDKAALAVLVGELASPHPATQQAAAEALSHLGFERQEAIEFLVSCLTNARGLAVESLVKLGDEVIPAVARALSHVELRDGAEATLKRYDNKEAVVAAVAPYLKHLDWTTRNTALQVLNDCGPAAAAVLTSMKPLREDADEVAREAQAIRNRDSFRRAFAWNDDPALNAEDPETIQRNPQPDDVPHLRQLLWARDERLRAAAMSALTDLGHAAQDAAGDLLLLLEDPAPRHAQRASYALGCLGVATPEVIGALENAAEQEYVAGQAIQALARLGAPALPALLRLLAHSRSEVRTPAIYHLGELRLEPDQCVPALAERALNADDCREAVRALFKFGKAAGPALSAMLGIWVWEVPHLWGEVNRQFLEFFDPGDPRLVAALDDRRRVVQIGAAELLAHGPHRDLAIRKFEQLLAEPGESPADSLRRIPGPAPSLVPGLLKGWGVVHDDHDVAAALRVLTTRDDPRIVAALDSPVYRTRLNAAAWLHQQQVETARSALILVAGVRDPDMEVQLRALHGLMIQDSPPECADDLIELALGDNFRVNSSAATALRNFGERARRLTPRLAEAFQDERKRDRVSRVLARTDLAALRRLQLEADAAAQGGRLGPRVVCIGAHDEEDDCTDIESPSWAQIESLIRRLDGDRYPHLRIAQNTADWMRICSGPGGIYSCSGDIEFDRRYTLVDPATPNPEEQVIICGLNGPMRIPRNQAVSLEVALRAARHFCEHDELDPQRTWAFD